MKTALAGLALLVSVETSHCQQPIAPKDGVTVDYSRIAQNDLSFSYTFLVRKAGVEFGRCLHGTSDSRRMNVEYTRPPFTYYATTDSVLFECEKTKDYLGPGHAHPQKNYDTCMPSAIDLIGFLEEKQAKIMAVFCDENHYLTIFRPSFEDSALAYLKTLPRRAGVKLTP